MRSKGIGLSPPEPRVPLAARGFSEEPELQSVSSAGRMHPFLSYYGRGRGGGCVRQCMVCGFYVSHDPGDQGEGPEHPLAGSWQRRSCACCPEHHMSPWLRGCCFCINKSVTWKPAFVISCLGDHSMKSGMDFTASGFPPLDLHANGQGLKGGMGEGQLWWGREIMANLPRFGTSAAGPCDLV